MEEFRTKLLELVPFWDSDQVIVIDEVVFHACDFYQLPNVVADTEYNTISIQASLVNEGYIYAVIISDASDEEVELTSYQIYKGTNENNYPAVAANLLIPGQTLGQINFTELTELHEYDVYLTCGANYPGQPILANNRQVYDVNWKTGAKPGPKALDLDGAGILGLSMLWLVLLVA